MIRLPLRLALSATTLLLATGWITAGDGRWTSNGPFGASIAALSMDPTDKNLVFASGDWSSLFRSTNGGDSWRRVNYTKSNEPPFRIRFHPTDPRIFIGFSDELYRSSDRGVTWWRISAGFEPYDIQFIPGSPSRLCAVGNDAVGTPPRLGVFTSADLGVTWTRIQTTGLPESSGEAVLVIDPSEPETLYVLLDSHRILKSVDGANTWNSVLKRPSGGSLEDLIIDPHDTNILYAGGRDGVFKTTTGGDRWFSTKCDCQVASLAVSPGDPQSIFGVGSNDFVPSSESKAVVTHDGGRSWSPLPLPKDLSYLTIGINPADAQGILVGTQFGGVLRSVDAGASFQQQVKGLNDLSADRLSMDPMNPARILAISGFGSRLYETKDGAETWTSVTSPQKEVADIKIHPLNSTLVVAAGRSPGIAVSTDGGTSWIKRSPFGAAASVLALDPKNTETLYVAPGHEGAEQGIAKSTDLGRTWKRMNSGLGRRSISAIWVDQKNSSILLAGTGSGSIFRSTNGGQDWQDSSTGLPLTGPIATITCAAGTTGPLFAAVLDYTPPSAADGGVFRSDDRGQTWISKSTGLTATYVVAVTVDPVNVQRVYAVGDQNLFVSSDSGESWTVLNMPGLGVTGKPPDLNDLAVDSSTNTLHPATHNGVFSATLK